MEISTRSKDTGSTERMAQKRKMPSPSHSSNGHSSAEISPSPVKKKKKPGAVSSSKDQSELRHGPFYYVKQPALTTDPVDVVPQDGRNDFYCWLCHREGQVLCCELCPRVYHAKCLKLPAEPEGDWFCPECEKITVAECIETQSKAMMMLTIDQLSYLLKFALQKMKQPGDHPRLSSRPPHAASTQRKTFNWTEPFQKPVSLEQHPDYAEYIFHPMDLCTLEKNIKKKMYGCTEAFLADVKWILHNCIIYNGGNHKLTATAKVIVKICEHEMNEIEVCPECYLSACQKRDNWFCEPCSNPHPLVWAKLKGFPFWPAKALRDKDGQVDARFFGQHDRAWVPLNNCYLMSKEIPFSVKKTKSIFNSAMQEMEVYVENMKKKIGVFNYAPFRTPYTPDNNFQMLLDPSDSTSTPIKPEKQEKIKLSFDMTASPKISLTRTMLSGAGVAAGRRPALGDMPRSPMSTNSSVHTGSDGEQEPAEKSQAKAANSQYSTGEESMDCTAGTSLDSPKPQQCQALGITKQERAPQTGGILNLNLDRSKAEMDLKELSESVQQKQGAAHVLTSPKRQIKSRFQLNLDKTIESCKAQLGINEISVDVYKGVEHSDSEDSDKSDSSESEYASDEEQKTKDGQDTAPDTELQKEPSKTEAKEQTSSSQEEDDKADLPVSKDSAADDSNTTPPDAPTKEKISTDLEKETPEETKPPPESPIPREKPQVKQETKQTAPVEDSDSERELVIDLGEEQGGKERKRSRKDSNTVKESTDGKSEGKAPTMSTLTPTNSTAPSGVSTQSPISVPVTVVSFTAPSPATISLATMSSATITPPSSSSASATPALKKQRPLLPREAMPVVQRAVVWNPTAKFQTSSQKWHMQKVQRQQQTQQPVAANHTQASSPKQGQTQAAGNGSSSAQQSSQSTRYQTRQAVKAVQQKDTPLSTSMSAVTLVSSSPASVAVMAASGLGTAATASPVATDLYIPTGSADVAADIAKYTNKIMDAIKGTMNEIYNDLSKSTSGNTIAEIKRLRIEIEKLQWLHQQELAEMKHNLELTMAEMRQSLEQERERLVNEMKKQMELEKQQAVDETKKKQWCANCRKEAIFYCCWNTSYCDYPCQQAHWPEHMKSCTQSATAPQQEPESEPTADLPNKGSGQINSGPNSVRDTPASAPPDKDCDIEKSTDSVAVTLT
ncbi:protein kinase C-binding protein 1 isoform X3 [Melanotaenia boesemani]|nr:protein kinase C-binding protein 1 isoform X3 [Melanotaenia boesemani]XP_041837486.1 protein kinase C-binding protein 1 isoform X3 [Melanotaenia boesemani]XP_041837487.1 protein kinase C-binding protein 1 isoform X3 [Melanotaenia boesemani]XP_041837488.1 protein kinase C-binding protein 1 isoform X3 [Melanotaenia boesemani]XP_041837489.1 protein kinase C-binding protein 1 isoform X3 [Melanotaenia boesemani]XP_041837490.1 protein kinase C-binding protein 1 isoform X3 [Melanotaenia boesemani]